MHHSTGYAPSTIKSVIKYKLNLTFLSRSRTWCKLSAKCLPDHRPPGLGHGLGGELLWDDRQQLQQHGKNMMQVGKRLETVPFQPINEKIYMFNYSRVSVSLFDNSLVQIHKP